MNDHDDPSESAEDTLVAARLVTGQPKSTQGCRPSPPECQPPVPMGQRTTANRFINNRLLVLLVLFCMTGCLGLPLLWMNQRFSTLQRWSLAIVVTLYTVALVWLTVLILMWAWRRTQGAW